MGAIGDAGETQILLGACLGPGLGWSARSTVLGGEEFGDEIGYGPARWLPPSVVADVADDRAFRRCHL